MTDQFWTAAKWAAGGVLGAVSGFLTTMPITFWGLIILMVGDYLTGVGAAFCTRTLDSNIGAKGLVKKAMVCGAVFFLWWAADVAGLSYIPAAEAVAAAFGLNEAVSMIENLRRAGIQLPPILKDALAKLGGDDG